MVDPISASDLLQVALAAWREKIEAGEELQRRLRKDPQSFSEDDRKIIEDVKRAEAAYREAIAGRRYRIGDKDFHLNAIDAALAQRMQARLPDELVLWPLVEDDSLYGVSVTGFGEDIGNLAEALHDMLRVVSRAESCKILAFEGELKNIKELEFIPPQIEALFCTGLVDLETLPDLPWVLEKLMLTGLKKLRGIPPLPSSVKHVIADGTGLGLLPDALPGSLDELNVAGTPLLLSRRTLTQLKLFADSHPACRIHLGRGLTIEQLLATA